MTPIELHRLAGAIATLRPDWPASSLQTFLDRHFAYRPIRDVAVALTYVALDPDTTNPGRVLEAGPWWQASATSDVPRTINDCPRHPEHGLRIDTRTGNSTCAGCHVDAHADDSSAIHDRGGRPIPHQARQLVDAALHAAAAATPSDATDEEPAVVAGPAHEPETGDR